MMDMKEVALNIYQLTIPVPLNVQSINVYIFRGETPTLIDTGTNTPGVYETIQTALRKLGIKHLEQVLITHWHTDHIGTARSLAEQGARIFIGSKDVMEWRTFAHGETYNIFREWARDEWEIPSGLVIEGMVKSYEHLRNMTSWVEGITPLQPLQTVQAGNDELQVVPVPGHTVGHIAFFEKKQGLLFPGDMLLPDQVAYPGIWLENGKLVSGLPSQLHSVDTMEKLEACKYFPAHGEPQGSPSLRCQETRESILKQIENYDPSLSVYENAIHLRKGKTHPGVLFMQLHYVFGWKQVYELLQKK